MSTPDPVSAVFYSTSLLARTGRSRPDDAYLAARAMALNGENKRAVQTLDSAGLVGPGPGGGTGGGRPRRRAGLRGDTFHGAANKDAGGSDDDDDGAAAD
ncbi:hypothetical protein THAOC_21402, partial [Thalassiosira oceanica]